MLKEIILRKRNIRHIEHIKTILIVTHIFIQKLIVNGNMNGDSETY